MHCAWGDSVNPCDGPQGEVLLLGHLVLCLLTRARAHTHTHTHTYFTGGEMEAQRLQINDFTCGSGPSVTPVGTKCRPFSILLFSRLGEQYSRVATILTPLMRENYHS